MAYLVQVTGEVLAGAVALVLLAGTLLVVRLRSLTRRRGTFDCALRTVVGRGTTLTETVLGPDAAWSLGVARTGPDGVRWWRSRSLSLRPYWRAPRASVEVERLGDGAGAAGSSVVVVRCSSHGSVVDLAMNDDAYTGFAAWLESLPPRDRGAVA